MNILHLSVLWLTDTGMVSHFIAITSSAAMSIPCRFLCARVRVSWRYIPRAGVAGVWGTCIFNTTTVSHAFVSLERGGKEASSASILGPCKPLKVSENRAIEMENK